MHTENGILLQSSRRLGPGTCPGFLSSVESHDHTQKNDTRKSIAFRLHIMKLILFVMIGLGLTQIVPFEQTLPILTSPVIQAKAGDDLNYQIANFRNESCQVTLSFHNSTFLPVSAIVSPKNCAGDQSARFTIPRSVPNGTAAIEWQCSGSQATSVELMVISGGAGDFETLLMEGSNLVVPVNCRANVTQSTPRGPLNCT